MTTYMHKRALKLINRLAGGFVLLCGLGVSFLGPAYAVSLNPTVNGVTTNSAMLMWDRVVTAAPLAVLSATNTFSTTISSQTLAAGTSVYTYGSLNGDTTYYFKVKISTEADSQYASVSTRTVPVTPSAADITYISETDLLLEWEPGTNPETTVYEVLLNPGAIVVTGQFAGMYIAGGLDPNTAYTAQVRAIGESGPTAYSNIVSSTTLAKHLSAINTTYSSTSFSAAWTAYPASPQSESCSGYVLDVSSNNDLSGAVTAATADRTVSTLSVTGLFPNTTYYYRAGVLNSAGGISYSEVYSFSMLSSTPSGVDFTGVWQSSAGVRWDQFDLSPASASVAGFIVEASSTNFNGTGTTLSSVSYSASVSTLTITGLLRNTNYIFRVGSLNKQSSPNYGTLVSSNTMAWPVDPVLLSFEPADTQVTVRYTALPLTPADLSCNGYQIEISSRTNGTAPIHFASTTQPDNNSFSISGLSPNRDYYARIGTYNQDGRITYTPVQTFHTTPGPGPANVVIKSTGVFTIELGWDTHPCDGYIVQASTDYGFGGTIYFSSTTNIAVSSMVIEGLSFNTTYYLRAGNMYDGVNVYTRSSPIYAATLMPPVAAAFFSSIGITSATLGWTPRMGSNGYEAQLSTASDFTGVTYSSKGYVTGTHPVAYSVQNLIPNTTYYGRVGTLNWDDVPNFLNIAGTTITLVADPYAIAPSLIETDKVGFGWNVNSNPTDTDYRVRNFSPVGVLVSSAMVQWSSHTFNTLQPNTSYYIDVTALGRNGQWGSVVPMDMVVTAANAPDNFALTAVNVTSMTVYFETNGNPAQTRYLVRASTDSGCLGTVGPACTVIERSLQLGVGEVSTSVAVTSMFSNIEYKIGVAAINTLSLSSWSAVALSSDTKAGVPTYVGNIATNSFSDVRMDQLTLGWGHGTNVPGITTYEAYLATSSSFPAPLYVSSVSTTGLDTTFVALSSGTTYYAWVLAKGSNTDSPPWVVVSTVSLRNVISTSTPNAEYTVILPFSYGNAIVFVPARTFNISVDISLAQAVGLSSGMAIVSPSAILKPTGIGVEITVNPTVQPSGNIRITIPYRVSDLPAGTDISRLVLAYRDEARDIWVPLPSTSYADRRTVEGLASHLSTFQIMEMSPSASLSSLKVFPNPFNPNSSNKYMQFTKLPASAQVRIYTYLGELVREMTTDISGNAKWDGRNTYGSDTASGVYVVLVKTADGADKKVVKIAVER